MLLAYIHCTVALSIQPVIIHIVPMCLKKGNRGVAFNVVNDRDVAAVMATTCRTFWE